MAGQTTAAAERLLRRNGIPLSVRRKAGASNPVTSMRPSAVELQVDTVGVVGREDQRSKLGDPLATVEAYYLVPRAPFSDAFEPRDGDLVISGTSETRILGVRKWYGARGRVLGYRLVVSGVAR